VDMKIFHRQLVAFITLYLVTRDYEMKFLFKCGVVAVLCGAITTFVGCKNDSPCVTCPPIIPSRVTLDTILVEPSEVDLHITSLDTSHLGNICLVRDSVSIIKINVNGRDTVIADTSVLPARIYSYTAYLLKNNMDGRIDSSRRIPVRTMDTTTHLFNWTLDTLGDGLNSVLFDITVVNDTLAYAVGTLNVRDSSGNYEPDIYNIARWDGTNWNYQRILVRDYGNLHGYFPLFCAFGFTPSDVWVASYADLIHWDGYAWSSQAFVMQDFSFNGQILKIWGTSGSNIYMVGRNGAAYHFDGTNWEKQQTGVTVDLTDVWGSPDGSVVWASGYFTKTYGTYLLKNEHNTGWQTVRYGGAGTIFPISQDSLSGEFGAIYTNNDYRIYVATGNGLYSATANSRGEARRLSFTSSYFPGFPNAMRGNGPNDIMLVGDYNFIAHYNGMTWQNYSELRQTYEYFASVAVKHNVAIAVGGIQDPINGRGLVAVGRR